MENTDNGKQRYGVQEAAEILHTSTEAVRQRIRRGTLEATREAGRVFVVLSPEQTDTEHTDDPRASTIPDNTQHDEFVEHLMDEIAYLRGVIDEASHRDQEMRRLLGAITQRVPEIEAPRPKAEGPSHGDPQPSEAKREPWYVRMWR